MMNLCKELEKYEEIEQKKKILTKLPGIGEKIALNIINYLYHNSNY